MADKKYGPESYVGTISDYEQLLAEYKTESDDITYWEQLLQPAQTTLQTSLTQAQTTAGYDITNAYKNYLQQQRQIQESNLLGTSRQLLGTQSKQTYESAYASAQTGLAQQTATAYEQFQKDYEKTYKSLQQESKYLKSIDEALWDYAVNKNLLKESEYEKIYSLDKETGQKTLTDLGKSVYQQILETTDEKGFNEFGLTLQDDEELYDYFMRNKEKVKQTLGGYSAKEYGGSTQPLEESRTLMKSEELAKRIGFTDTENYRVRTDSKLSLNAVYGTQKVMEKIKTGEIKLNTIQKTENGEYYTIRKDVDNPNVYVMYFLEKKENK